MTDDAKSGMLGGRGMYEQLDQSLVGLPDADTGPLVSADATPMIEVVAPATLPEGYTFEAQVGGRGRSFTVKVPMGGVEEGQKFTVPLPGGDDGLDDAVVATQRISVPVGHWRDGLCDCCKYGVIHSMLWNACCCPAVLTAQVMTRLKLNVFASPGSVAETAKTFWIVLYLVLTEVTLVRFVIPIIMMSLCGVGGNARSSSSTASDNPWEETDDVAQRNREYDPYGMDPCPNGHPWADILANLSNLLRMGLYVYTIVILIKTRGHIRSRYGIPEQNCRGCEDLCCSVWCTCCVAAQMARHTTDYDTYRGVCCTDTGLPSHVPAIV